MKGMQNLMKQAQQMQQKMATLQKELESRELETSFGGGMIKIKITGKQQVMSISINKECIDPNDVAGLEDLVKTAVNQAIKESQDMVSGAMSKITGGISIPGMF